ncbi:uncharacterized protein LOC107266583 isoform X2 [Cephus cinctus]|uniref:Uncharacterized protein LOC107266583 isoform X2 n=1 Tax=Cephus cinctus TaxID=211228 RepID=A0AAJ7RGF6_CEPCN|nr:uncharacterized protein LOC107266583 isoform X2 [Cephus cinctus]
MRTESLKKSGYAEIRIVNLREKKQSLTAKDVADLSRKSSTVLDCCRSCKPVSRLSSVPVVVTDVVEVADKENLKHVVSIQSTSSRGWLLRVETL